MNENSRLMGKVVSLRNTAQPLLKSPAKANMQVLAGKPSSPSSGLSQNHLLYQYHVTHDGRLNCLMYQRSCDLLLGAPFNWTGTVALQLMLAQQAGLAPGEFVWMGGDVHLYLNHLEQARLQLQRAPRPLPTMRLLRHAASIDDYRIDDFAVDGYDPHPPIKADVAV